MTLRLPALCFTSRCIENHVDYKKSIEINGCLLALFVAVCLLTCPGNHRLLSWNSLCKSLSLLSKMKESRSQVSFEESRLAADVRRCDLFCCDPDFNSAW